MSRRLDVAVIAGCAVAVLAGLGGSAVAQIEGDVDYADPRSQIVLELDCESEVSRSDVTLFANGTVRLRKRQDDVESLLLAELTPDELAAYRNRLRAEGLREDRPVAGVTGDWLESCRLVVERPQGSAEFRFGRTDSLPLGLSRVVRIADELRDLESFQNPGSRLPFDYQPRRGDVLEDADGRRFRIRGFSVVGTGVELEGLTDPLTLYLDRSELRSHFVELVDGPGR